MDKKLEFRAAADESELLIYGDIGVGWDDQSVDAKSVVDALDAADTKVVRVRINSPGGSVFDALAIYNALKNSEARIIVQIDGVALSSASLVAMAGDEVQMAKNAMLMIHAPWVLAAGNSVDLRKQADVLDRMSASMATSYASKTGKSQKAMLALLTDGEDHWYSADEAKKEGFVDTVIGDVKPKAEFDFSKFRAVPSAALVYAAVRPQSLSPSREQKPVAQSLSQSSGGKAKMDKVTTFKERLDSLTTQRETIAARMNDLTMKCGAVYKDLPKEESDEYDRLSQTELPEVDGELRRLRAHEVAVSGAVAASATDVRDERSGVAFRQGARIKRPELAKGILFTRYALALAAGRGSISDAVGYAKSRYKDTPEVADYIYMTAQPGTTLSGNWAEKLVNETVLVSEFIELLRPATIVGRMDGLRKVPFNVKIQRQTDGSLVDWVGQASAKPVGELGFDTVSMPFTKIAGIIVLTDEQVRFSNPSSEATTRDDLVRQCAQFIDQQFVDPSVSLSAGVHPASITNGVTPVPASGVDADAVYADVFQALGVISTANKGQLGGTVVLMNTAAALGLSMLRNPLGVPVFPTLTVTGGTFFGFPALVSDAIGATDTNGGSIIFVKANEIFLADDGTVALDASREATLDMAGGDNPVFNLWQKNCVAIKAERFINWQKRRDNVVAVIGGVAYGPTKATA